MAPGLVLEGFLMDTPERSNLVLHGLLWAFTNRQATWGRYFFTLLRLLVIITLLEFLRRVFYDQWFSLWCQNRISLSSFTRRSSVEHSWAMYPLAILAHITSFYTSSRLMGGLDGISVEVGRSSTAFRHWS